MSKHNSRFICFSFCPNSDCLMSVMVVVFDTSICHCSWYSVILGLTLCLKQYNVFVGSTHSLHILKDF
jgi:hypothetical protein